MVKRGGLYTGDVAAQYKHKNSVLDFKFDTESNVVDLCPYLLIRFICVFFRFSNIVSFMQISSVLTVTDILPSTNVIASLRLPDYNSGKVMFSK